MNKLNTQLLFDFHLINLSQIRRQSYGNNQYNIRLLG